MPRFAAILTAALLAAAPATADIALLVGNASYDNGPRVREARAVLAAQRPLREAGFRIIEGANLETESIREGLSRILEAREDDGIVIALSGHFVEDEAGEVWFLGFEADTPDRGDVGAQGVDLRTVMTLAEAAAPGRALVLLGVADRSFQTGRGLTSGLSLPEPPQGVTVVAGPTGDIARLLWGPLMERGTSIAEAVAGSDSLEAEGFLSRRVPFLPRQGGGTAASSEERALWEAAAELDTRGAYRAYLNQYPSGRYAPEARAALSALRDDPARRAEEAEAALNLDRADRREIQRGLTVLGYDTRGVDGIFGPGTRGAIRAWQRDRDVRQTGYLTADQRRSLLEAAAVRQAEIDAEEATRQAEREAQDRRYWLAVGESGTAAGLTAYLERYPDGLYADIARARLGRIEGEALEADRRADQQAWIRAGEADTPRSYRTYLEEFPDGRFADRARDRLADLTGRSPAIDAEIERLEAAEADLDLPGITRILIERRLQGNGFDPGQIDGEFTPETRAALASFQDAQGLEPTGYLDRDTLARFLADGIRVILQ